MSKSTKLITAAAILSFIARRSPERVTTNEIAAAVKDHPTRVRQIVAALVKSGLINATRGASGGVVLSRPPAEIDLHQVYEAVEDPPLLAIGVKGNGGSGNELQEKFEAIYASLEEKILRDLSSYSLAYLLVGDSPGRK
ncbi:MAG: Rrf2 family transcriptional regulator [Hyphomicrobiales bacterium]|nr:Rrf2 family transcriptional regulator [Hyphomicrobiales bacterium]MCP5370295.1 Rrf2 family transcriptional regulator [Hyphomicrobiales bacterium]